MSPFLSALFWGLLVLSLLVFAHEGGHFLAARLFGMRVTEFFLGLPSRWRISTKSKRYGTEFGVTPFLLGGYNRICGMEGDDDELLAAALSCVQTHGRIEGSRLAEELHIDIERAYALLATLTDWGSIEPYYNPELGEAKGQADWPEAFQTLARDAAGLTEYDRDHDFSAEGTTHAGEPHPLPGTPSEALDHERAHTYLGKSFWQRLITLVAGPAVNIIVAILLVVFTLSVLGIEMEGPDGPVVWHAELGYSIRFAFEYALLVAQTAIKLLVPTQTMEILGSSSSVVGVSVMASEAAAMGAVDLLLLVASVSMSLGFMNLLPIPPLDGGKILIEVIQLAIGHPLSRKMQNAVSYVGLAFFLFVFIVALRNDLLTYVFS